METPIDRLPPELLADTFEHLEPEIKTLCIMVCRNWRVLIKGIWSDLKVTPHDLLCYSAESGNQVLMRLAKRWLCHPISMDYGRNAFEASLISAARGGQIECMKLAKMWSGPGLLRENREPYTLGWALSYAAENGHIECMKLIEEWSEFEPWGDFNPVLVCAARGGQLECMKLAKKWGAFDYGWALAMAACNGHIECMELIKEWGKVYSKACREAEHQAYCGNHIECMNLAAKWQKEEEKKEMEKSERLKIRLARF